MNFKLFMENSFERMHADIPMPKEVRILSELFRKYNVTLFAVGGAIRDFLYHKFHDPEGKYSPKDVDLATEAQPDKVMAILNSDDAKRQNIKVFPKGEAFGVISAILNNQEFEIATFREEWYDPEKGDGRRPDKVSFSTPAKDAQRRDLTFNALFYDIDAHEIRDYNLSSDGKAQGIEDLKNLVARPVGNARERFQEDKLRIPRLIRFFSKYNPGEIQQHLDKKTLDAIEEFKDLAGVSPERISKEFETGLEKSISPVNYILNYKATGLLPTIFPNMKVDIQDLTQIGKNKNLKAVLAWILKNNNPALVKKQLNLCKYSSEVANTVGFLIELLHFNPQNVLNYVKWRDARSHTGINQDIADVATISGMEILKKIANYQQVTNSQDFMHLKGPEISRAMAAKEAEHFQNHN